MSNIKIPGNTGKTGLDFQEKGGGGLIEQLI